MIFHDFGVPKKHPKSIPKTIPKTARFWTLLGSLLGAFWHLRWLKLKPLLESFLERPRAVQEYFLARQMLKWMLTGRVLERSRRIPGGQDAPRGLQGVSLDAFGSHLGLIWTPFWTLGSIIWDPLLVRKDWFPLRLLQACCLRGGRFRGRSPL